MKHKVWHCRACGDNQECYLNAYTGNKIGINIDTNRCIARPVRAKADWRLD